MPIIPAHRRQKDGELNTHLGCVGKPCLKRRRKGGLSKGREEKKKENP
jgi:hypothetical protein